MTSSSTKERWFAAAAGGAMPSIVRGGADHRRLKELTAFHSASVEFRTRLAGASEPRFLDRDSKQVTAGLRAEKSPKSQLSVQYHGRSGGPCWISTISFILCRWLTAAGLRPRDGRYGFRNR